MRFSFGVCAEKRTIIKVLLGILLIALVLFGGAKINAAPGRCLLCHSMKPEYYTWQASLHGAAEVSCVSCHSPPGIKGFFTAKSKGFKELYSTVTASYVSPIRITAVISDKACEKCHNRASLDNRNYGDLKVSHDTHRATGVRCVKCHTGLAHGQIADRKVTFVSDYAKWGQAQGKSMMSDKAFTKPNMDVCFRCHRLRAGPVTCTACHQKTKLPANHKNADFKVTGHGRLANSNIKSCDNCHRYMTVNTIEGFSETQKYEEFLGSGKSKQGITAAYYSRANGFCKKCHSKRPKTHDSKYIENHRLLAGKSKTGCLTCHNNQKHRPDPMVLGSFQSITQSIPGKAASENSPTAADAPPTSVTCGSCHPSSHSESIQWKSGFHPVTLPANLRITRYCYYCHRESECSACHGKVQSIKIKKEE